MWTLDRYIITHVIRTVLLVASLVVALFFLILLIEELDSVGTGNYTWPLALKYVLLQLPKVLLDLSSFIALVGTIIALGILAGHNEVIAMHSLAVGSARMHRPILVAIGVLMIAVLMNAQFLLPRSLQTGHVEKQLATSNTGDVVDDSGYWSQNQSTFLHVGHIAYGRIPADIVIYEFDDNYRLVQYIQAESADVSNGRRWILRNARLKVFRQSEPFYDQREELVWNSFLSSKQLGIIMTPAVALSLTDLRRYVKGLDRRGEPSQRFELILWERLLAPIATALMVLIGMQFVFGSSRSFTMGKRITVAILAGLFFYFISRIIGHLGLILHIAPPWVALTPVILMGCVLYALRRMHAH